MQEFMTVRKLNKEWDSMKPFISSELLAFILGRKPTEITRMARNGEIPGALKIGGRWYFSKEVLRKSFEEGAAQCGISNSETSTHRQRARAR